jgi:hypothetical protein
MKENFVFCVFRQIFFMIILRGFTVIVIQTRFCKLFKSLIYKNSIYEFVNYSTLFDICRKCLNQW